MNIKNQMEDIYRNLPLDKIPWNMNTIPDILQEFARKYAFSGNKIIELGCGAGNYVVYFAGQGFDAAGVDISDAAIELAQKSAAEKNLQCRFFAADVIEDISVIEDTFDLAYDWELLHHIFPQDRDKYAANVRRLLKPGGHYLSVCFSDQSDQFGGKGKYRKTPLNTELYFSSETEIESLFNLHFEIIELQTVEIAGKYAPHQAVFAHLKKRFFDGS